MSVRGNRGINSLTFNRDHTIFACCTENGLRIYNVEPLFLIGSFGLGGIMKCEILNQHSLIAIISGGKNARYCQNTVMILNTDMRKFVAEIVCPFAVKSVLTRRDMMIVVTLESIFIFKIPEIRCVVKLVTDLNPMGLCVVSAEPPLGEFTSIIAFPGDRIGRIYLMKIIYGNAGSKVSDEKSVLPYEGEVSCLAINLRGTLVACANSNGTVIGIWDTFCKAKVVELRRGLDTETIYCMSMNFSTYSDLLCCSSDKGIIHIFKVLESGSFPLYLNSSISSSRRALATIKLPSEVGCICTYLILNNVVAICLDGTRHMFKFSMNGSTIRTSYQIYL